MCTRTEKLNESRFKVLQTELGKTRIGTDRIIVILGRSCVSKRAGLFAELFLASVVSICVEINSDVR